LGIGIYTKPRGIGFKERLRLELVRTPVKSQIPKVLSTGVKGLDPREEVSTILKDKGLHKVGCPRIRNFLGAFVFAIVGYTTRLKLMGPFGLGNGGPTGITNYFPREISEGSWANWVGQNFYWNLNVGCSGRVEEKKRGQDCGGLPNIKGEKYSRKQAI